MCFPNLLWCCLMASKSFWERICVTSPRPESVSARRGLAQLFQGFLAPEQLSVPSSQPAPSHHFVPHRKCLDSSGHIRVFLFISVVPFSQWAWLLIPHWTRGTAHAHRSIVEGMRRNGEPQQGKGAPQDCQLRDFAKTETLWKLRSQHWQS